MQAFSKPTMSLVKALALIHTTKQEAGEAEEFIWGKADICVFRAYRLNAKAPEKEWRRHRGTLESVSDVENSRACV